MTLRMILTILALALLALPAAAQLDDGPDGIGIYADLGATINSLDVSSGLVELYVLATNIQAPEGVGSWELALFYDGPISFVGYLIPYNHINVGTFPCFIVGASQDVRPPAPIIRLMTLTFLVLDGGPAEIWIRPADLPVGGSLGNDLPVYINGDEHGDLRNMYPSSGSIGAPVFRFNAEAPVAVTATTWSGVKAMFR